MLFGFKNKETGQPLSEEDIRNRLYGGAVGITAEAQNKTLVKKHKNNHDKSLLAKRGPLEEHLNIKEELQALRKELNQTKKRLERIKGLEAKKIRQIILSIIALLVSIIVAVAIIKGFLHNVSYKRKAPQEVTAAPGIKYTIQVAVSENNIDAQKFSDNLKGKGYDSFVRKSYYKSGKEKFAVYIGGFKNKEDASSTLKNLKTKERIGDSFITTMPD